MAAIIFDTTIYIAALRQGDASILALRRAVRAGERATRPLWLSAVVLAELYAGAADTKTRQTFARLEREFGQISRLLIPNQRDWSLAGQVLARIGVKYGFEEIGRARLTNDALIALSAARNGFTVWTKNAKDYARIAEFRSFQWEEV